MSRNVLMVLFLIAILFLAGCGETFRGIGADARRIGKGIKTIFVSE